MTKTPKLHELLAVVADTTNSAAAIQEETASGFKKKPDMFRGQIKDLKFFDESRANENTTDRKELVTTVEDKLAYMFRSLGRHYDVMYQLEASNQNAKADLVVGDVTLIKDAPAPFLLGMETRLKHLRATLLEIPTLDPAIRWTEDSVKGRGIYVSDVQKTFKTEKKINHKVLYDATDKHPAQIEKWNEDRPVATVETTHVSGMITPNRKSEILERLDKLIEAVKRARQRANSTDAVTDKVAAGLFSYLMGE